MTKIINVKHTEELSLRATELIVEGIRKLLSIKQYVVLGRVGGRSVGAVFQILKHENIPWNRVHIFMVDERLVPITNKKSNFLLAKQYFLGEFLRRNIISSSNVHPFIVDNERIDYGIMAYRDEIKMHGGIYDIVLLSSGEDGHVGALFPNHDSIKNDSDFFISMKDSPKPPPNRMSASKKLLLKSQIAILLISGDSKKNALRKFLNNSIDIESCPSKIVNQIESGFLITDIN